MRRLERRKWKMERGRQRIVEEYEEVGNSECKGEKNVDTEKDKGRKGEG